jgi:flavin-dependent dehydrogenase
MNGRQVRIETPLQEKRIGSVHRGTGPRKLDPDLRTWKSFDGHLQELAIERGARPIRDRVKEAGWDDGRPLLTTKGGSSEAYDLVAVAVGINSPALKLFEPEPVSYELPETTRTFIREYHLGERWTEAHLGNAMHVFLLNIPGLEFAAIIPKLNCATVCMLGDSIEKETFQAFIDSPEVRSCMPLNWEPGEFVCQCSPRMNIGGSKRPFGDRIVFIGDSGVTRLYKDGIGAAYRTAKAAARTAVFEGVSADDFERHFQPTCAGISADNRIGRMMFRVTEAIKKRRLARETVLRMVMREQADRRRRPRMSTVLWDMFTGSASYREILLRALHPAFLVWELAAFIGSLSKPRAEAGGEEVGSVVATTGGSGGQA